MKPLLPFLLLLALGGCLVRTAANVATMPVRATAKVVDWTTTSQSEADRNRGRRDRKAEEKQRKEQRRAEREARRQAEQQPPQ
ncbi:hypothetical protein [Sphingomonas sp. MMS24-J13]|uniref:hypothetical protein n=1 Tax=Sphingomonas sp. MMS24-J13 TaxID=3238686 RepID=UPI00384D1861